MTSLRWYLLGLLALFGLYVALEYYRPKPIDWTPSLVNKDKIPYGTYALYDVLPTLLGTDSVESLRLPIYNQFYDEDAPALNADTAQQPTAAQTGEAATPSADTLATATPDSLAAAAADSAAVEEEAELPDPAGYRASYVFIEPEFTASGLENNALRRFVSAGNDVFIAARSFGSSASPLRTRPGTLPEQLGVSLRYEEPALPHPGPARLTDSVRVRFVSPALAAASIQLPGTEHYSYFEAKATTRGTTLATDEQGHAVLVRLDYGRGHFYLCSLPLAFSNYYVLLPRSRAFALAALSYLPTGRPVWWDEYQKQGRVGEQSVLRLVMSHEALRWAYYLLLATVLVLVLVEARRRQRVIPTLKPLPNTTLLFTRTVASLYRQGRNHQRIADKQVALFLDYLRTRFHEASPDLGDDAFRERLSQKAGVPRPRVDELLRYVNFARTAPIINDAELLKLSRAITQFKREAR